ncbi:histone-fold-containing protein, partial [Armillaria nabsnona]
LPLEQLALKTFQMPTHTRLQCHRFHPGTMALRIRRYQNSTNLLIRKLPFQHLAREKAQSILSLFSMFSNSQIDPNTHRLFLVSLFKDANAACLHAKRVTLMARDVALLRRSRGVVKHDEASKIRLRQKLRTYK